MNNPTTYTLLVGSEEKGRNLLETAVYAMCILSAIVAIWQFAWQPNPLPAGELTWRSDATPRISHHQASAYCLGKS